MGVSGCGKSTIGKALSKKLNIPYYDADHFHSAENKKKMNQGIPLNDDDRSPWLNSLAHFMQKHEKMILSCSSLKHSYRNILNISSKVCFIYLKGSYKLIHSRLKARHGHFFKPELLDSQFAIFEEPVNAITVDIAPPISEIVSNILIILNKRSNQNLR